MEIHLPRVPLNLKAERQLRRRQRNTVVTANKSRVPLNLKAERQLRLNIGALSFPRDSTSATKPKSRKAIETRFIFILIVATTCATKPKSRKAIETTRGRCNGAHPRSRVPLNLKAERQLRQSKSSTSVWPELFCATKPKSRKAIETYGPAGDDDTGSRVPLNLKAERQLRPLLFVVRFDQVVWCH